jgi:hypothetical protein
MHGYHGSSRHPLLVALAALAVAAWASAPLAGAEIRSHVAVGYDSFIDRFTILDVDTLESIQELYLGLGNALLYGGGATKAEIRNFFRYGNQTIDDNVDAECSFVPARSTTMDVRGNLHWKRFQKGSDYEFGNDYTQADAIAKIRRSLGEHARLSLRSRFEIVDYRQRTEFDYDYRYLDAGAQIEAGPDFSRMLLLGATVGSREVSDTTALSFDRVLAELVARLASSRGLLFHFASAGDRKEYRGNVRSSYWSFISFLDIGFNAAAGAVYSLRGESELTAFDRPDETYFDTHFLRGGFRIRLPVRTLSSIILEPRYARMLCRDYAEERYTEGSFVIGAEIMQNERLWITFSYEPGYRNYTLDENELYSDFYLHRLSAMGSMMLPGSMELNMFITHEPERHSRRADDFSVTLVSIDLTRRF